MEAVLSFMGSHPILTFFLVLIVGNSLVGVARAIMGTPVVVRSCGGCDKCKDEDEE